MIFPQQTSNLRESELRFVESVRKEFSKNNENVLEEKEIQNRKAYRSADAFSGINLDPKLWEENSKIDKGFPSVMFGFEGSNVKLTTPVNEK